MKLDQFEAWSKRIASWSKAYLSSLRDRPVRARGEPGDVLGALPAAAPEQAEDFDTIFADFERLVPDAMTHWQHPRFFAYFPANAAPVSMLAEQLANTIAAQCMLWQTSPAATEMETRMVDWLRQAMGHARHGPPLAAQVAPAYGAPWYSSKPIGFPRKYAELHGTPWNP